VRKASCSLRCYRRPRSCSAKASLIVNTFDKLWNESPRTVRYQLRSLHHLKTSSPDISIVRPHCCTSSCICSTHIDVSLAPDCSLRRRKASHATSTTAGAYASAKTVYQLGILCYICIGSDGLEVVHETSNAQSKTQLISRRHRRLTMKHNSPRCSLHRSQHG